MERKGDASEVIMAIFAIAIGLLIIYLLVPKIAMPSMGSYGDQQAYITAKILASSINSLSSTEQGEVLKTLELEWDIEIECKKRNHCYLTVSHKDFSSGDIDEVALMGSTEETSIPNAARVRITKETEKPVRIEKLEED